MLNSMIEKELVVVESTAEGLKKARETEVSEQGLPSQCRHALYLYIKEDNVKTVFCRSQPRGKITYIKIRTCFFRKPCRIKLPAL